MWRVSEWRGVIDCYNIKCILKNNEYSHAIIFFLLTADISKLLNDKSRETYIYKIYGEKTLN